MILFLTENLTEFNGNFYFENNLRLKQGEME